MAVPSPDSPAPIRRRKRVKKPNWTTEFVAGALAHAEAGGLTVSDAVYDLLHEAIGSGRIPPGAELRERDFAETHKVSRTPAREALRRLLDEQLLIRKGKSLMVATRSLTDVEDGLRLRGAVMLVIIRLAIERATEVEIDDLAAQVTQLRAALDAGDLPRVTELVKDCDRTLFSMAHSPIIYRALVVQIGPPGLIERMLRLPNRAARTTEDRVRILAALRARDQEAGAAAVRLHVDNALADIRRDPPIESA